MFNLERFGSNTACISQDGTQISYRELDEMAAFISKDCETATLAFILCGNNIATIAGYVGLVNKGIKVLLLDKGISESMLSKFIEVYKPEYLWMPKELTVQHCKQHHPTTLYGYSLIKRDTPASKPLPKELSVLLSTSGSTGSPKLVRLSQKNILSNAESIRDYLQISEKERPITSLPLHYSFGLSIINSHLIAGATILLTERSYVEKEFWDYAIKNGITSFSGVPYTYEILKKLRFWGMKIPSLKTLTQAGGKLGNDLIEFFVQNSRERGIKFIVMYGQTEASPRMSYLPEEYALTKLGSIGIPIPGGRFEIHDSEGGVISTPSETGELVFFGDNVCLGYAETRDDLYKDNENHGILHTGDLGYKDNEGFIYVVGRTKRFVKIFGNRISLDYLEVLAKSYLTSCVCVGDDQKITIYTTDTIFNEKAIISAISLKTKLIGSVFAIKHIDNYPRSDSGKIQYSHLSV